MCPSRPRCKQLSKCPILNTKGSPPIRSQRGEDQGYLTIQQENEQIIPFFLEASQIQQMVERFKQEQPAMADSIVIDVIAMENVISTLQTSDDAMLKQIRIVPTQEAIQFIRSLSAQQPK
ncbi:hypothetical protein NON20_04235 [Synechocystis sp. B12]|nr:hypothetical protein NON20_04235 [Synechocystis sp. B12]